MMVCDPAYADGEMSNHLQDISRMEDALGFAFRGVPEFYRGGCEVVETPKWPCRPSKAPGALTVATHSAPGRSVPSRGATRRSSCWTKPPRTVWLPRWTYDVHVTTGPCAKRKHARFGRCPSIRHGLCAASYRVARILMSDIVGASKDAMAEVTSIRRWKRRETASDSASTLQSLLHGHSEHVNRRSG